MSKVEFTLNGETISVNIDEATGKTLNEYIRHNTRFTGTKVSCAQGGCGACTVAVARPSQPNPKSICSCITPLATMHGAAVLTVEGLTAADDTPHPLAERLGKFNGTQCGFCTPGMVMQLFSTLNVQEGGKAVKESELEQCINGNICRCTGYRPIVECAKSFASDTTVKNWLDPSCAVGPYDPSRDPKLVFPAEQSCSGSRWLRPANLEEAVNAISKGATPIAGGTAAGIYRDLSVVGSEKSFVDISTLLELKRMSVEGGCIEIGAAVTWNEFTQQLTALLVGPNDTNKEAIGELRDRCASIAGAQVRNAGTVGGNVTITRNKGFLSDWVPPLAALGAKVKYIERGGASQAVDLLSFVQEDTEFTGLIVGVSLPLPSSTIIFRSFRVAKRSRNAHALVNAAFSASLSGDRLDQVTIVLGAVDPKPLRLKNFERALGGVTGQALKENPLSVLRSLCEKVKTDLFPLNCAFGRDQTDHIISGFAVKFLTRAFDTSVPKEWHSGSYCLHDMPRKTSSKQTFPTPVNLGGDLNKPIAKTTAVEQGMGLSKFTDDLIRPVGTLIAALVLCPEANVKVTHPLEGAADVARKLLGDRFHSIITAGDIPVPEYDAMKIMGMTGIGPDYTDEKKRQVSQQLLLPVADASQFAGQPVALLLAHGDQPRLVERAALAISEGLKFQREGPIEIGHLTEGVDVTAAMILTKGKPGVAQKLVEKAKAGGHQAAGEKYITGRFSKKSQSHFYMEGQSVVVIPDETGLTIHVATQAPDILQKIVSHATGLQQSKIAVKFRRVGGGFGGKVGAPSALSAICAQCAMKTKTAVRLVLPRETDMELVGGRQEMDAVWRAAVNPSTGKISAVEYEVWYCHGAFEDMQKLTPLTAANAMDMVYGIPNWHHTAHLVKQHVPNRTATRAPGHYEAVLLAEAMLDGIASELGMDGLKLREANFFQGAGCCGNTSGLAGGMAPQGCLEGYSNLTLWQMMKQKTNYEAKAKEIQEFNTQNTWKKRGIAITPARYGVFVAPGNSARIEIFKDGSLQIAVSGVEIGQGLHTKVGQALTTAFADGLGAGPPMDAIRFLECSTEQIANGGMTGGSTTSEGAVYATISCCEQLVAKLKVGKKVAQNMTSDEKSKHSTHGQWYDIVNGVFSAKLGGVLPIPQHMTAASFHRPAIADFMYETYGVASTELELDVLSGESRLLKSHVMFDIGKSYNPMIDVGQVEGSFIMGMGQHTTENIDFDKSTGKLLNDNTWTYKPPIACDVPETFNVDLVDLEHNRLEPCCIMGIVKCVSGIMSCCSYPWKPTKIRKVYKSAKAVGEPPLLLAASVQSAHHKALVAATGTKLPDNHLPIPAKPFDILPLLSAVRPGKPDDASETASTATPLSVA